MPALETDWDMVSDVVPKSDLKEWTLVSDSHGRARRDHS